MNENKEFKLEALVAVSYTHLMAAHGEPVGKSLLEEDYKQYALDMEKKAEEKGVKLLIPVDNVVADDFSNDANFKVVERGGIPDDMEGLDTVSYTHLKDSIRFTICRRNTEVPMKKYFRICKK